ncbi:hypothetical protein [Metallosphaera hakonensis]|uniref:Uncharacterized protein n=1 Tax=Metallosphaera hakonensis JCM 8857 = DSM 7519 TaxID=1293036 RepID=A0A2U9IVV8_9CREN|nr:hypothetical protein [Metallosphaera hakonensis]AWS00146.1 hypothetical protein DFR87_11125 [Metallosphaera hakonensis JCM 8857 = DSM 7519]
MSNSDNSENKQNRTVTIRGVDSSLYDRLVKLAHDTGKTVGEITNQAIGEFLNVISEAEMITYNVKDNIKSTSKAFLDGFNESRKNLFVISNVGEITVFKAEIVSAGKPISFRNIGKLVLPDLDEDTLEKFIDSIVWVDELVIPPSINKIMLMRKARFIKKITSPQQ